MAKTTTDTPSAELTAEELLQAREEELNQKEATLNEREETLNQKEATLNEREETLNQKEADLVERESKLNVEKTIKKVVKGKPFTFNKEKYKFTNSAPQKIRIDGEVMTQKEITEDEEILLQLVGGGSGLIEKIRK